MATADFTLHMTLNGNPEELLSMLEAVKRYSSSETPAYFTSATAVIDGKEHRLDSTDIQSLKCALEENDSAVKLSASGPYGRFSVLNDVDIFRDMAEAAPDASIEGQISGSSTYSEQNLSCELKDGRLHISTYFLSNEECPQRYSEYFRDQLPYEEFTELFQINPESFDECDYGEFIECCVCEYNNITDVEYDEFMCEIGDDNCELDSDGYDAVMEQIFELDIMSYAEYIDQCDPGYTEEFDYDPVAKVYVGSDEPMKYNTAYDATETMRDYLRKNSLPCDDDAIASLSVEDAYAIMAGTYGKDNSDESAKDAEASNSALPAAEDSGAEVPEGKSTDNPAAAPEKAPARTSHRAAVIAALVVAALALLAASYLFCAPVKAFADSIISLIGSLF